MEPDAETIIEQVIAQYRDFLNPGLARLMQFAGFGDVEACAEGCVITTEGGRQYLDFVGGFGVFNVGHRHPRVVAAVKRQLDRMPLSTRTFFNAQQAELAARLISVAPEGLQYVFFSNSGAEAVEAALKFARVATGRPHFVSAQGSYHGKTLGALAVTGREKYRTPFEPLMPGVAFVPFNDLDALQQAVTEQTAAVILEPVQGEGGIHVARPGYLQGALQLCRERGALLILDEVQTGMGRTGRLFACEHEGVWPDILTLAKGLGGGVMPIGATLATPTVWEAVFGTNPLLHTSTFGGNPLACAAGVAALEVVLEEDLPARAARRGEQLMTGLRAVQEAYPAIVKEVRGLGLMVGVECTHEDVAGLVVNQLAGNGVIAAYTLNNPCVIRMEPPLVVTEEQVDAAVRAFHASVESVAVLLAELE